MTLAIDASDLDAGAKNYRLHCTNRSARLIEQRQLSLSARFRPCLHTTPSPSTC